MASRLTKLTITTSFIIAAQPVSAWEVTTFGGQETIFSSEVLPDPGATGWVGGGNLLWSAPKLPVSLGLRGAFSQFRIDGKDEVDQVTATKTGSMYGYQYGPTFVV